MKRYVCSFRGRRDSYQVAIALEENNALERLVTDFYSYRWITSIGSALPKALAERLNSRRSDRIQDCHVQTVPKVLLAERCYRMAGVPQRVSFAKTAGALSLAAAEQARKSKADLLLYHSYAWQAFNAPYSHQPRRVLFQYHPHYDFENSFYDRDAAAFPEFAEDHRTSKTDNIPSGLWEQLTGAWKHSDLIICASSFTKQSLVWAGADPEKCVVVPYGSDPIRLRTEIQPQSGTFQALFVGTGEPRKGLHHLLLAWRRLRCPFPKKLVVVCGTVSPRIGRLINKTPDVEVRSNLSPTDLAGLYASSHLFAMPSLVEGFGLVYTEALSYGCPVLGTRHSGLPDVGDESDGIFIVEPGEIDELTSHLERLATNLLSDNRIREAARHRASLRPWGVFRRGLVQALGISSAPAVCREGSEARLCAS